MKKPHNCQISLRKTFEDDQKWRFELNLNGLEEYTYIITAKKDYVTELLKEKDEEVETLIERAFIFLLDHQALEEILKIFELSEIEDYFPEFREKLAHYQV